MSTNVFFVSAFITNVHQNDKSIENYIDYGKKMVNLNMNQIIFLEKDIFDSYFKEDTNETIHSFTYEDEKKFDYIIYNNIYFIFFEKKDMYLYEHKNNITNFQITTNNPNKDTVDYMFVQCHKTEWIKMSIFLMNQQNNINVNNIEYIWLDFGIYHIIKNDEIFKIEIQNLNERTLLNLHEKIHIGGIWDLNHDYGTTQNNRIAWYFAGGIFGGSSSDMLIQFADLMKKKCLEIINERNTFIWEVNIWHLIYLDNKDLFDVYRCDHNVSMLANY
jgi:hypothetical protein